MTPERLDERTRIEWQAAQRTGRMLAAVVLLAILAAVGTLAWILHRIG